MTGPYFQEELTMKTLRHDMNVGTKILDTVSTSVTVLEENMVEMKKDRKEGKITSV